MHVYTCYTSCSLCFADSFNNKKISSMRTPAIHFIFWIIRSSFHIDISFAFAGFGFGLPAVPKTPNHRPCHVLFYIKLLIKSLLNLIILIYSSFCILAFQGTKATSYLVIVQYMLFHHYMDDLYIMLFYVKSFVSWYSNYADL